MRVLHYLYTVNSVAHHFGYSSYDYCIRPTENRLIAYISLGKRYHNYHHTFPTDYRSSGNEKLWEQFN
ncbi:hypothetical protein TYRP_015436 [Tyrophagus putrescentiae]|nr:hypothetical protein TYRP_015436 [Tyrophagus putrescentiae]